MPAPEISAAGIGRAVAPEPQLDPRAEARSAAAAVPLVEEIGSVIAAFPAVADLVQAAARLVAAGSEEARRARRAVAADPAWAVADLVVAAAVPLAVVAAAGAVAEEAAADVDDKEKEP